jgi:hypothetical protein
MNRRNLVGPIVALAATAALCGCASAPVQQGAVETRQEATANLEAARNAWAECVRTAIPRFDTAQTASEVVAGAAMNACSDRYTTMWRALERTTCGRDSACTRDAAVKAQRDATRTATDEVMSARVKVAGAQVLQCQ